MFLVSMHVKMKKSHSSSKKSVLTPYHIEFEFFFYILINYISPLMKK